MEFNVLQRLICTSVKEGNILNESLNKIVQFYLEEDYVTATIWIRKALENMVDNRINRPNIANEQWIQLCEKIYSLKHRIPDEVYIACNDVRKTGNNAVHHFSMTHRECSIALNDLNQILLWYLDFEERVSILDCYIKEHTDRIKRQQLAIIKDEKTLQVMQAQGKSLFKRMEEESTYQFEQRIKGYPKVTLGEARMLGTILLDSSILPLEIIWYGSYYENPHMKYYIDFKGVVDQKIFLGQHSFEVLGKYKVGINEEITIDDTTLELKIGNTQYSVQTLSLIKTQWETSKAFAQKGLELGPMPIAQFTYVREKCDIQCGFYMGILKPIPGTFVDELLQEFYYFFTPLQVDIEKANTVFAMLQVEGERLTCAKMFLKVQNQYVRLSTKEVTQSFVEQFKLLPVGTYCIQDTTTDLEIGFVNVHVTFSNMFFEKAPKSYIIFIGQNCEDIEKVGKVYGKLGIKDEDFALRAVRILYKGQEKRCYDTQLLRLPDNELEQLQGIKIPIGCFEYIPNGFDRLTGYCPFNMIESFPWVTGTIQETEYCTYIEKTGNPVTGAKSIIYGELVRKETRYYFGMLSIVIAGKSYPIKVRNLEQLSYETDIEYSSRISKSRPIGTGYFDPETLDIDKGSCKFIVKEDKWYRGVIPIQNEIYCIAFDETTKMKLLKKGEYTLFATGSKNYKGRLYPDLGKLSVHVDQVSLEIIAIANNLKERFLSNCYGWYFDKLTHLCAGYIDAEYQTYNADEHIFSAPIIWNKWASPLTEVLQQAFLSIEPAKARSLFERKTNYKVYLVFLENKIEEVFMFAGDYYALGFEALNNLPVPYVEEVIDSEMVINQQPQIKDILNQVDEELYTNGSLALGEKAEEFKWKFEEIEDIVEEQENKQITQQIDSDEVGTGVCLKPIEVFTSYNTCDSFEKGINQFEKNYKEAPIVQISPEYPIIQETVVEKQKSNRYLVRKCFFGGMVLVLIGATLYAIIIRAKTNNNSFPVIIKDDKMQDYIKSPPIDKIERAKDIEEPEEIEEVEIMEAEVKEEGFEESNLPIELEEEQALRTEENGKEKHLEELLVKKEIEQTILGEEGKSTEIKFAETKTPEQSSKEESNENVPEYKPEIIPKGEVVGPIKTVTYMKK